MSTSSVSASDSRKSRPRVTSSHFAGLNSSASMDGSFLSSIANLFLAIKKPPRRTACAAVGFAPTSPQSRALLVLCYFPCFLFSHMSVTLSTMARSSGVSLAAPFAESGSSPRMRGTPPNTWPVGTEVGIIPACAGNTKTLSCSTTALRDHPRVCGEHAWVFSAPSMALGSSPRVRGTPYKKLLCYPYSGIIPACAGNTCIVLEQCALVWDHPRVCGEHFHEGKTNGVFQGSSPRVRGTQDAGRRGQGRDGIIPACAGNTYRAAGSYSPSGDHPRVCGEHLSFQPCAVANGGSSPRVRGTLRFIGLGAVDIRDHPRVCGEHS